MRDYVPLKESDEDSYSERERKASSSPKLRIALISWLPAILTACTSLILMFIFHMPSTLHVYLAFIFVYGGAALVSVTERIAMRQQRLPLTSPMVVAFSLLALPFIFFAPVAPTLPVLTQLNAPTSVRMTPKSGVLFVAANLYNSEAILPSFTASLFKLAQAVGQDSIFISIYESNSHDRTKKLLKRFDDDLESRGIPHHIELANTNDHIGVEGNFNRIEFLANVRNKVYDALETQPGANYKDRVDRVLWLNDIFFDANDVLTLLSTNDGKYDVACGLDYIPLGVYDTWVMHDVDLKRVKPLWPYFARAEDVQSLRMGESIRMRSCWNGIVVFNADLLIDGRPAPFTHPSSNASDSLHYEDSVSWPLRFRKSGECLTSECLSINYDLHLLLANDRQPDIFINPSVRVAYDKATYVMYSRLIDWRIVRPWRIIWEDIISNHIFYFLTDLGRKKAECAAVMEAGFNAYTPRTSTSSSSSASSAPLIPPSSSSSSSS